MCPCCKKRSKACARVCLCVRGARSLPVRLASLASAGSALKGPERTQPNTTLVSLAACARRLFAVGTGLVSDPGLVNSVSRSGDRTELLKVGRVCVCVCLCVCVCVCLCVCKNGLQLFIRSRDVCVRWWWWGGGTIMIG